MESNFFKPPGEKEIGLNDHLNALKSLEQNYSVLLRIRKVSFGWNFQDSTLMEAIINFFLTSMECFIKRTETNDSKNGKNGRVQEGQIYYDNHQDRSKMMRKEHSRQNKLTCRKEKVDLRDFFVVEILEQIKMQYIMSVSQKLTIINSLSLSYQWHTPQNRCILKQQFPSSC